jgi:hypothetical protein
MLAEVETALIARIKAVLNGSEIAVTGFPGDSEQEARAGRQARVFVGYKRSRFELASAGRYQQTAEFEIVLMVRNIRTYVEAYPLLDAVRFGLTGFWPTCDSIEGSCYPVSESFLKVDDGIWYYSQVFAIPLTISEPLELTYGPPFTATEIRVGLWRASVGSLPENLDNSVFVKQITINNVG